jgi:hypothetical protein
MGLPNVAVAVLLFGGFLLLAGWAKQSRPEKEDQVALVPTKATYLGSRHNDDKPEADLTVWSPHGERWDCSIYADGLLYEPKTQGTLKGPPRPDGSGGIEGSGGGEAAGAPAAGADAGDGGDRHWRYELTVHRYTDDWTTDLGAWGGLRIDPETGAGVPDVGVRYSPVRLLDGVLAPDALISPNQAGLGISAYMPSHTITGTWRHLGLGLGYAVGFDGGGAGWVPYVALSTRF